MLTPRSYLYVPGDRPEMLTQAGTRGAHALIIDLEDGVAPERKAQARVTVSDWLSTLPTDRAHQTWIRVNNDANVVPDEDLRLVIDHPPAGVVLPKAESARGATAVAEETGRPVIALIESARGILNVAEMAEAQGVQRLAIGEVDLAADLRCEPVADVLHPLRMLLVVASSAAGLTAPIGPVSTDFRDLSLLVEDTKNLRRIGFGARAVIHPDQIAPVNDVFAGEVAELEAARRLISRSRVAEKTGSGVFLDDDGRMVDRAVLRQAERLVAEAEESP